MVFASQARAAYGFTVLGHLSRREKPSACVTKRLEGFLAGADKEEGKAERTLYNKRDPYGTISGGQPNTPRYCYYGGCRPNCETIWGMLVVKGVPD